MYLLKNKIVLVLALVVIGAGIFLYYVYRETSFFIRSYEIYAGFSLTEENAVYLPAQPDNPVRKEMNQMLAEALTGKLSDTERLERAQRGLVLVKESQDELAPIQDRGGKTDQAISYMERMVSPLTNFSSGGAEDRIIANAKRRADIVSDVRALTVRANFETGKVFQRIVDSRGKLTPEYITELNADLPALEEQFNRRTALYGELDAVSDAIVKEYAGLSVFGLPISGK